MDYDCSVLRVLKKHFLPQLPLYFLFKKLQMLLQFPPPPLVGGVWEYTRYHLKTDEREEALSDSQGKSSFRIGCRVRSEEAEGGRAASGERSKTSVVT